MPAFLLAFFRPRCRFRLFFAAALAWTCLYAPALRAQSPAKPFRHAGGPEIWWAVTHPFVAKKCLKLTREAQATAHEMKSSPLLNGNGKGDQVDAFRHAYWMALLASRVSWRKARSLGRAHERSNYRDFRKNRLEDGEHPDQPATVMDLWNNERGLEIGRGNPKAPPDSLQAKVVRAILAGDMRILARNEEGQWLDCDGNVIPPEELQGTWENRKCLLPSHGKHD